MASEHTLTLIIEAIDKAQDTFNAVEGRIRGIETATKETGTRLHASFNGIQQGFNQIGQAASTGLNSIRSGLDPLKGTLDTINAGVASMQQNVSRISATFGGLLAAIPIVAGIGAAAEFMGKSLRDAGKETQNFIALEAVWRSQNRGTEAELVTLIDQVKALSRTSSYASQDVIASMKFLAGFPSVATQDLLPALQTAIDFAAYQNVGIQEATRVLSFAATGRTAWLEHFYGFKFSEAVKNSKDFSLILKEMGERVGGQEAAKMATYAGAVGALEKAFNRVEKAIGHVLEAAIVPVLQDLVSYFSQFGKAVEAAFEGGATEEWEARFRELFQNVANYTKGIFESIRNFATTGGFDRLFTALTNVVHIMQTLISVAGSLVRWFSLLPKEVFLFIAIGLGLTAIIKIVRGIWSQWQALWTSLRIGKATVTEYATTAVAALSRERIAVDAVTAAYDRKRSAQLSGLYAVESRLAKGGPLGSPRVGFGAGTPFPVPTAHTPTTVPTPSGVTGGKWNLKGAAIGGVGTAALTGLLSGDITTGLAAGGIEAAFHLLATNLGKVASILSKVVTGFSIARTAMVAFMGTAAGTAGTIGVLVVGALAWGKVLARDIPNAWDAARRAAQVGTEYTKKAHKEMQAMIKEGYQPKESYEKVRKADLEGLTVDDRRKLLHDQQKDLEYEASKFQLLVGNAKQYKEQGADARKRMATLKENLQVIRDSIRAQQETSQRPAETVNLLEDIKAVREKHKYIMDLARSEFDEKKTLLSLELAERKAVIAETIKSTILAQQAILRAEQDTIAKRMALIVAQYDETRKLQDEAYTEEKAKLEQQSRSGSVEERTKAVRELAKLDRDHAKQQIDTARQATNELQKELQRQYDLRAQFQKKITDLQNQAQDAERATAQSLRSVTETAASEYDRLRMKLEDARNTLDQAAKLMPTFPEKALQLAKEAQGAFTGLAQNIDSLEQNIRTSEQFIADALRKIDQSRLTGVAKWRAELNNLRTDMQRAEELAVEGRYKEAEAAYKRVIQQAQQVVSSAPAGLKGYATQEAKLLVSQAGADLLAVQRRQRDEAVAANERVQAGIIEAGNLIKTGIEQQIQSVKENIQALSANTEAIKNLINRFSQAETQARTRAAEETERLNKPVELPEKGTATAEGGGKSAAELDYERLKEAGEKEWERKKLTDAWDRDQGGINSIGAITQQAMNGLRGLADSIRSLTEGVRPSPSAAELTGAAAATDEGGKLDSFANKLMTVADKIAAAADKNSTITIHVRSEDGEMTYDMPFSMG